MRFRHHHRLRPAHLAQHLNGHLHLGMGGVVSLAQPVTQQIKCHSHDLRLAHLEGLLVGELVEEALCALSSKRLILFAVFAIRWQVDISHATTGRLPVVTGAASSLRFPWVGTLKAERKRVESCRCAHFGVKCFGVVCETGVVVSIWYCGVRPVVRSERVAGQLPRVMLPGTIEWYGSCRPVTTRSQETVGL